MTQIPLAGWGAAMMRMALTKDKVVEGRGIGIKADPLLSDTKRCREQILSISLTGNVISSRNTVVPLRNSLSHDSLGVHRKFQR